MIKSDKWIKRQCMVPTFVVYHYVVKGSEMVRDDGEYSWSDELTLARQATTGGIHSFRALTEEEKINFKPMIEPFEPGQVRTQRTLRTRGGTINLETGIDTPMPGEKIISWGLTSMGYDVRLADTYKVFSNINNAIIDPLKMSDDCYVDRQGEFCIIPPNSYILGHTIETFDIPRDVIAVCVGKSTYARAGIAINVTPIEPGFKGQVVIEIANQTPLPAKVYAGMGIAQFLFYQSDEPCEVSYADRDGKYQNQKGITTARV